MNTVSLELGLRLLGEPPYTAAKASELLELVGSRESLCPAADLTRLEHLAGSIASGDARLALDLAVLRKRPERCASCARRPPARNAPWLCWLRPAT